MHHKQYFQDQGFVLWWNPFKISFSVWLIWPIQFIRYPDFYLWKVKKILLWTLFNLRYTYGSLRYGIFQAKSKPFQANSYLVVAVIRLTKRLFMRNIEEPTIIFKMDLNKLRKINIPQILNACFCKKWYYRLPLEPITKIYHSYQKC